MATTSITPAKCGAFHQSFTLFAAVYVIFLFILSVVSDETTIALLPQNIRDNKS
jgi:hypothetical protein